MLGPYTCTGDASYFLDTKIVSLKCFRFHFIDSLTQLMELSSYLC